MMRSRLLLAALCLLGGFCALPAEPLRESDLNERLVQMRSAFEKLQRNPEARVPGYLLARAEGVAIFRKYEAGFIFGGRVGYGVAFVRGPDGSWSAPAFLRSEEGSFGLQAGARSMTVVYLLMDDEALELLREDRFRAGVDAAATAGPADATAESKASRDVDNTASIYIYGDAEGLYAGAAFEGGLLRGDTRANSLYYGGEADRGVNVADILFERAYVPTREGRALLDTLRRHTLPPKGTRPNP